MAAPTYIGTSAFVASNGASPGAITPHPLTRVGDLILWFHYSAVDGGDETVTPPSGFTTIFNGVSAGNGLVACAWKVRDPGDTTYTHGGITNHTSSAAGESIIQWCETWRGQAVQPIGDVSSAIQTFTTSTTNAGPITSSGISRVPVDGVLRVFIGRHDDLTTVAQDTLTGDSLTWTEQVVGETTSGADAGVFSQAGTNATAGELTSFTDKTITGFGASTTATGAGCMFVILPAPLASTITARITKEALAFLLMGAGGLRKMRRPLGGTVAEEPQAPGGMIPQIIRW